VAVLWLALVLVWSAPEPVAVFELPLVLLERATYPLAVLAPPVVLLKSACEPVAVLLTPLVLRKSARNPAAALLLPVVSWKSAGEALECVLTLGRVGVGIASVRCWANRLHDRRKRKAAERERNEKKTAPKRRAAD
jgi:hypothetical protein